MVYNFDAKTLINFGKMLETRMQEEKEISMTISDIIEKVKNMKIMSENPIEPDILFYEGAYNDREFSIPLRNIMVLKTKKERFISEVKKDNKRTEIIYPKEKTKSSKSSDGRRIDKKRDIEKLESNKKIDI